MLLLCISCPLRFPLLYLLCLCHALAISWLLPLVFPLILCCMPHSSPNHFPHLVSSPSTPSLTSHLSFLPIISVPSSTQSLGGTSLPGFYLLHFPSVLPLSGHFPTQFKSQLALFHSSCLIWAVFRSISHAFSLLSPTKAWKPSCSKQGFNLLPLHNAHGSWRNWATWEAKLFLIQDLLCNSDPHEVQ